MAFDLGTWELMHLLYGDEEGPRQFQIRKDREIPFNLHTERGRRLALKYLYSHLPFELFKTIFNILIGMSTEVVHPISGQLVDRGQMRLSRVVFFRMFVCGPETDQVMLWDKRFPSDYNEHFCKFCGDTKLSLCWTTNDTCIAKAGSKCRHPRGNYRCHRSIGQMGSVCYFCTKSNYHNLPMHRI